MTSRLGRGAASLGVLLAVLLGCQVLAASSAAAHAELVSSTPSNGERLEAAPTEAVLEFTESVALVDDGVRLLDDRGEEVATGEPAADGRTVRLPLPDDLPTGSYLVSWRVISADSHPISGAFSFGVGVDAEAAPDGPAQTSAPWPVQASRALGYVGYVGVAGVVVLVGLCWPGGRSDRRLDRALLGALALGGAATLLSVLLQGPYVTGAPMTRLLDRDVLSQVGHNEFGAWMQVRLLLYVALAAVLASSDFLRSTGNRWGAGLGLLALAVTFPGTGHAAAGDVWDRAVVSVHVVAAGVWVGGLLVLAGLALVRGDRPDREALLRFSRLALASVVVLVATGTLNSLMRLDEPRQLWATGYGRVLLAKVLVVAVVVAAGGVARARLRSRGTPSRSIRVEALGALVVLVLTAVLSLTTPPPADGGPGAGASAATTVEMGLTEGRRAEVRIDGPTTAGSRVRVFVLDADGRPQPAAAVRLTARQPERQLGPLDVALEAAAGSEPGWTGTFTFPVAGTWELVLTVEYADREALVTGGRVTVR